VLKAATSEKGKNPSLGVCSRKKLALLPLFLDSRASFFDQLPRLNCQLGGTNCHLTLFLLFVSPPPLWILVYSSM
jgi:hypothetical protein